MPTKITNANDANKNNKRKDNNKCQRNNKFCGVPNRLKADYR